MDGSEQLVSDFLHGYGLEAQRFTKKQQKGRKSPDFKVYRNGSLAFYCEVKAISEDERLDQMLDRVPAGTVVGIFEDDPSYSRVASKIHTAAKQFDAVNGNRSSPNVLVFVNDEDTSDFNDFIAVFTGGLPTENGDWEWFFRKYSEGRIKQEKLRIDLFIWLEDNEDPRYFFTASDDAHNQELLKLFRVDTSRIKRIP